MAPTIIPPSKLIRSQIAPELSKTMTPDDICTVQEICTWLKVDRKTIYRAVADGRLPVIRLGASGLTLRFYKPDVLRMRGKDPR